MKRARGRRRHLMAPGIVLAYLLLAWCPCAFALDPALDISQYAHTAWKIRDGFTKGTISSITQTPDGYLWLGTEFGLLRFDGVRAVPWQPPPDQHLPSNRIFSLLAARDGTLWIGTSKGLASWNGSKLIQYPELAGQTIRTALLEDHEGTVWAGGFASSAHARLCTFQKGSVQCYGEDGSLGNGVSGLYEDRSHNVWVGVQNGLWRWKPGPPKFYAAPGPAANGGGIQGLADGDDGSILFGALNGTRRLLGDKNESYPVPTNVQKLTTTRLLRDSDRNLWIGTSDGGLVHVHQGRTDLFTQSDGLSGDFITALFTDREGTIWIATDGGLDRFREFAVPSLSLNQGLSNASILSVLADRDGSVWLSTRRGLNRWSNGQITIFGKSSAHLERNVGGGTTSSGEPGGLINGAYAGSMFQDRQGRIWVSTIREFGYLEIGRFISLKAVPGGVVYCITEDTDGDLWIANKDLGLIHLLRGGQVQQIPWTGLGHKDPAMALAVDPLRRGLWVGFYQGGIAYFADGQVRASYSAADGLGQGRVNDLRFDSDGTLWAATEGGLSRLKNDRVATLTSKNGLPCDSIHWAMDEGPSFWLYTTCGLVRVARSELDAWAGAVDKDKEANSAIHATVFDSSDGVRSLEDNGGYTPHVAKSPDGRLWFLPSDGVSVIDPRRLPFNRLPPPVQVEQISADRKSYASDGNGQLRLPPLVRDLEIDYTALSLIEPEKVLFRYKLEGWDRDWIDAGNRRQAIYSNLPPNNYRFRVMACNNSGVWNEAGAYFDFSIAPAYYQTAWFRLSIVAAVFIMLAALYQMRVRYLRRQFNVRLEDRLEERERIARDLHDTFLQSVQGLIMRFHAATRQIPAEEPARQTMEDALYRADEVLVEGRDRVRNLRGSSIPVGGLPDAFKRVVEEIPLGRDATFKTIVEGKVRELHPMVREESYSIGREALINALKHSNGLNVEVKITYDSRQFHLRVRDDGRGIDPEILEKGSRPDHFGLQGMRERANKIGARLQICRRPETGTEVELIVPGATAYIMPGAKV